MKIKYIKENFFDDNLDLDNVSYDELISNDAREHIENAIKRQINHHFSIYRGMTFAMLFHNLFYEKYRDPDADMDYRKLSCENVHLISDDEISLDLIIDHDVKNNVVDLNIGALFEQDGYLEFNVKYSDLQDNNFSKDEIRKNLSLTFYNIVQTLNRNAHNHKKSIIYDLSLIKKINVNNVYLKYNCPGIVINVNLDYFYRHEKDLTNSTGYLGFIDDEMLPTVENEGLKRVLDCFNSVFKIRTASTNNRIFYRVETGYAYKQLNDRAKNTLCAIYSKTCGYRSYYSNTRLTDDVQDIDPSTVNAITLCRVQRYYTYTNNTLTCLQNSPCKDMYGIYVLQYDSVRGTKRDELSARDIFDAYIGNSADRHSSEYKLVVHPVVYTLFRNAFAQHNSKDTSSYLDLYESTLVHLGKGENFTTAWGEDYCSNKGFITGTPGVLSSSQTCKYIPSSN